MSHMDTRSLGRRDESYLQRLAGCVARANGCQAVLLRVDGHPNIDITGQAENVEQAEAEYRVACTVIGRATRRDWEARTQYILTPSKHKTAFWMGVVSAIEDGLLATAQLPAVTQTHDGQLAALKEYRAVEVDAETYYEGYAFGQKLRLVLGRTSREAQRVAVSQPA